MIPAAAVALSLALVAPTQEPPTRSADQADEVRRKATTLYVLSGFFAAMGIGLRSAGLARLHTGADVRGSLRWMGLGTLTLIPAAGVLYGASDASGIARGYAGDRPPSWKNGRLGWGLLVGGAAVFVATRFAPVGCFTTACAVVTSEGGHAVGVAAMSIGLHAIGVHRGYRRARGLSMLPRATVNRGQVAVGLEFSGKF